MTPYYLLEDYSKTSDLGKSKTILRAGVIYSRVGDRNTSSAECATKQAAEFLWKKRFGLVGSDEFKVTKRLKNIDCWYSTDEYDTYWINELGLSLNRMTDSIKYYAYIRYGIEFLAFKLFFTKQCYEGQEAYNKALTVIPVFENEQTAIEAQSVDELFPEYAQRVETVIVYKFGKTLVEWLYQWRWKIR